MEITAALGADLSLLSAALVDLSVNPRTDVAGTILGFATTTRLAVASFLGLSITITDHTRALAHKVVLRLTLLDDHSGPGDVETSLVLPETSQGADPDEPDIQVVLYAATPGAFVDLAADLAFLTGNELNSASLDHHRSLAREPDITGLLQDESAISQAIGVLLAGGSTRDQANAELDTLADAAHTDRATEASRILTALTPDCP